MIAWSSTEPSPSGIAGLSAAWTFARAGVRDFALDSIDELRARDLVPFRTAITADQLLFDGGGGKPA